MHKHIRYLNISQPMKPMLTMFKEIKVIKVKIVSKLKAVKDVNKPEEEVKTMNENIAEI